MDLSAELAPPISADRATTAVRVYARLHDEIVSLRRAPRAPLREKELAAGFGVSRTPIREAILRLADERLVDIFPQRGTFVAPIKVVEVLDALFLRLAVEEAAARVAAEAHGAEAADALAAIVRRQEEAAVRPEAPSAFYRLDEEFHQTLMAFSGHPTVWRTLNNAKAQMDRVRRLALPDPGHFPHVLRGHRRIVATIGSGDGAAAAEAARAHLLPLEDILRRLAEKHPDYFDFTAA